MEYRHSRANDHIPPQPIHLADWTEFHEQVDALTDEHREVFNLLWYQDLTQAEAAFRRAAATHPLAAAAFNNLAQTLADQGKFDAALEAARKAVSLGGASLPAAQATLQQILHKRR